MFITLILLVATVTAEDKAALAVSCNVHSPDLLAGDPLLVKITIRNQGADLSLPIAPAFTRGNWVEVRNVGDERFSSAKTKTGGSDALAPGWEIGRGDSWTDYDFLLPAENEFLRVPGDYEIRTATIITDGTRFHSPPVRIHVAERPAVELGAIWGLSIPLHSALDASMPSMSERNAEPLLHLEDKLGPSELRTMLVWSRMLYEFHPGGEHADVQQKAILDVARIVDPVTSEVIRICLAEKLHRSRQYELALEILQPFKERNMNVENIRVACGQAIQKRNE